MFIETAERLNSINKTPVLDLGWLSATIIFGSLFLIFLFLVYPSKAFLAVKKIKTRSAVLILMVIFWLPIFVEKMLADWQHIGRAGQAMTATTAVKSENNLCVMDTNDDLMGSICLLEPFVKEVKKVVPAGVKVNIVSRGFYGLYLKYAFTSSYQITSPELADYWLIYSSEIGYQLTTDNELLEVKGEVKKNLGRFQIVEIINKDMVIIKRQ